MISWQDRTIEFQSLRKYAKDFAHFTSVVEWLYAIGVVPNDVKALPEPTIKTELDPKSIKCGYLAASAFQWDSWGPSSPGSFVDALEFELAGSDKKEAVADALRALGKAYSQSRSPFTASLVDAREMDGFRASISRSLSAEADDLVPTAVLDGLYGDS